MCNCNGAYCSVGCGTACLAGCGTACAITAGAGLAPAAWAGTSGGTVGAAATTIALMSA